MRHKRGRWGGSWGFQGELLDQFFLNRFDHFYITLPDEWSYFCKLKNLTGNKTTLVPEDVTDF